MRQAVQPSADFAKARIARAHRQRKIVHGLAEPVFDSVDAAEQRARIETQQAPE